MVVQLFVRIPVPLNMLPLQTYYFISFKNISEKLFYNLKKLSRAADEDASCGDEKAAQNDLEHGATDGGLHVSVLIQTITQSSTKTTQSAMAVAVQKCGMR